MNIRDEYWDAFPVGELQRLRGLADSRPANLAEFFGKYPDSILAVIQAASSFTLTEKQAAEAKAVGLSVAENGVPIIALLAERWAASDGLEEFSAAVQRTMLPN
ncbi:hypothetical protein [Stutzerimonas stutzeri]|uniref:hypothetical protein n=1 Tax=Stutzerimonas stutzeri TaxID=316 RepID=UPI001BD00BA1|nr:hypothetical protein [Stutzerimonas stutzeri]